MCKNLEKFGTILLDADLDVGVSLENLNNRIKELSSSKKLDTLTVAVNITGIDTLKEDLKTILQDVKEINDISSKMSFGSNRSSGGSSGGSRNGSGGSSSDADTSSAVKARRTVIQSLNKNLKDLESYAIKHSKNISKTISELSKIEDSRSKLTKGVRSTDYRKLNDVIRAGQENLKSHRDSVGQQIQLPVETIDRGSSLVKSADVLRSKFTSLSKTLLSTLSPSTDEFKRLDSIINESIDSLNQLRTETDKQKYGESIKNLQQVFADTKVEIDGVKDRIKEMKKDTPSSPAISTEAKNLLNRANTLDRTVDRSVPVGLNSGEYDTLKNKLSEIKAEILEIDKISDTSERDVQLRGLVSRLQEVGNETRAITNSLRRLDSFDNQIDSAFYARSLDSGTSEYERLFTQSGIDKVYEQAKAKVESLRNTGLPIKAKDIEILKSYVAQINSIQSAIQKTFDIQANGINLREALESDKVLSGYKDLIIDTEKIKNLFNADGMQSIISGSKLISVETSQLQGSWHSVTQEIQLANGQIVKLNMGIDTSNGEVKVLGKEMRSVTTGFVGFFNEFRTSFKNLFRYFLNSGIILRFFRSFKQGISDITAIDDAIRELKKVTDETDATYQKFAKSANSVAVALGHSTESVINATSDFAKLGYSFEDAQTLAKNAVVYSNVGDMDIDSATQSMVSTMKAFGIETKNSMQIIDAFNEVGNKFSISSAGIGEALQRGAAALAEGGNTLNESIGLITASNTVLQDPDVVGTAMKTLALRLRGVDDETGELIPKMREFVKMYSGGVDIMENDTTFKSTTQILRELASVWDDLTDVNRAGLLEKIAGQRQGNAVAAILNNFEDVEAAITTATNSYGSAEKEQSRYMDSIAAKTNEFKETVKGFWLELISSDSIKTVMEIGTAVISSIQGVTKVFGSFTTIVIASLNAILLKAKNTFSNIVSAFNAAKTSAQEAGKAFSLSGFFKNLGVGGWAAIGTTVVTTIFSIIGAINQANEARRQALIDSANELKQDADQIDSYKERVSELQGVLQNSTSTYDDIKRAKEELISIQDALYDKYGLEAEGLDLVNGKLQTQLDLIDDLSANAYTEWLMENKDLGEKALRQLDEYTAYLSTSNKGEANKDIQKILEANGFRYRITNGSAGSDYIATGSSQTATANEVRRNLVNLYEDLEELKRATGDYYDDDSYLVALQKSASSELTKVKEVIESNQDVASRYIEATVFSNKDLLENYRSVRDIVNKYNNAVANSDLSGAEKAKDELREMATIITGNMTDANLGSIYNEPFENLISQMDTAGEKAIKLENIIKSVGETEFEGLSNKDLYDGLGGEAFSKITEQASKLGFSVEDVIDKMTELGVVVNDSLSQQASPSFLRLQEVIMDTSTEGKKLKKELSDAVKSITDNWRTGAEVSKDALDTINQMLGLELTVDGTGTIETLRLIDVYLNGGVKNFKKYLDAAVSALGIKPNASGIKGTIEAIIASLNTLTGSALTAGTTLMTVLSAMGAVKETYRYEVKPQFQAEADKLGMEGLPDNAYVKVSTGYKYNDGWFEKYKAALDLSSSSSGGGGGSTPDPYQNFDIKPYREQQAALESIEYQLEKNEAAESAAGDNMVKLSAVYKERAKLLEEQKKAYDELIPAQIEAFNNEAKILKEKYGIDLTFDPNAGGLVVKDYGVIEKAIGSTNKTIKKNAEAAEKALDSAMDLGKTIMDNSVAYDNLTGKIVENTKAIEENNEKAQNKKLKELIQEFQESYLNQIQYAIDDLQFAMDSDPLLYEWEKEITALEKKLKVLKETNETEKKALELEKQKEAYEKAKNQRTNLIYRKGEGFVWEADPEKVKDESDKLTEKIKENEQYALELQIKNLENLRDERKKFYQDQIDAIQRVYDKQKYTMDVMAREVPMTLDEITKKFNDFGFNSSTNLGTVNSWITLLISNLAALNGMTVNPITIDTSGFNGGIIYPDGEGDIPIVDEATWEIPMHSTGTLKARKGLSIVGENGPELRVLGDGDGIIPSEITKNLWEIGKLSSGGLISSLTNKLKPLVSNGNSFSVGEVHLHEVKDGQDFCRKLINELPIATQQILYRRR